MAKFSSVDDEAVITTGNRRAVNGTFNGELSFYFYGVRNA
jgi:hypothetical protein